MVLLAAGGLLLLPIAAFSVECLAALLPCRRRLPSLALWASPEPSERLECGDLSPLSERPEEVASRFSGDVRRDATLAKTPESGDKSPHSKGIFACFGASVARPRTAVLVPAHDEQAVIGPTLRAVLAALAAGDRLPGGGRQLHRRDGRLGPAGWGRGRRAHRSAAPRQGVRPAMRNPPPWRLIRRTCWW